MKKILILDDVEVNLMLLKNIINKIFKELEEDVELIGCETSDEFFNEDLESIDLFLLDVSIPGKFDGVDLLNYLLDKGIKSPVIMHTAYLEYDIRDRIDKATDVFYKPYRKDEIRTKIIKYLF